MRSVYISLFIFLLIGGETVLIPAVYLAITGVIDIKHLVIIAVIATTVSDSIWYMLGRLLPSSKIKKIYDFGNRRVKTKFAKLEFFDPWYLPASKFVYGVRIIAQVTAGIRKMPFTLYLSLNILGFTSWLGLIIGISLGFKEIILKLNLSTFAFQIIISLTFVIVLIFSLWLRDHLKQK